MDRLSPNRSDLPYQPGFGGSPSLSGADFKRRLKAALINPGSELNKRFTRLLNQLADVRPAHRPAAANELIKQSIYLGHEEQMALIVEAINIIHQAIENQDPSVKESVALNLEQEIADATDLSYAPAANVFPLYSMLMQMARLHGLNDFSTALALRLIARIRNAPPHHRDGEFNAGILMIAQCPPELQRAYVIDLLRLLPKELSQKIDVLERIKEQADPLDQPVRIPITQKLFQARLDQAATEKRN